MARGSQLLTNLTGGELSPLLDVRTDTQKYRNGAKRIRNAIVMPHGGVRKRPGTMHIQEIKASANGALLVPFLFNTEQAYIIELGAGYMRFYKDRAIITATAKTITGITQATTAVVTAVAHGFSNGEQVLIADVVGMTQVNNRRFTIANVATDTFELQGINSTAYTAYSSAGTAAKPIEIANVYLQAELDALSFTQTASDLYIAHPAHPIRKLTRTSHTVWTLSTATIRNGPFRPINADTTHYLSVAVTGSASITAATKASPCVITTGGAHGFEEGCNVTITSVGGMTALNNNKYIARNVTSTTFELWTIDERKVDSTGFGTYTSGGTATISTTVFGTISPGSKVTLTSTDSLFTASHVGALFRLWEPGKQAGVASPFAGRTVANNDQYTNDGKVYGVANLTGVTEWSEAWRSPSHESGVIRIFNIAGDDYHDSVYLHDSSCVLEVIAFASATSVTARVKRNHIPASVITVSGVGTSLWEEGAWSAVRGYPACITFYRSRLWGASTTTDPQYVWASRIRAPEDFRDGADDDDAIVAQMASDTVEIARWFKATGKALLIGTASGEHAVGAATAGAAITPSSIQITPQTPYGSSGFKPIRAGDSILFGQRRGKQDNAARRTREANYSFEVDKYIAPNLTIVSEHITGAGISEGAYVADPDPVVWHVRTDGLIPGLTYEPEQDVKGWHLHTIAGAFSGSTAVVERMGTIPGADADELWLQVKRTVNGATVRYIEFLTAGLNDNNTISDGIYLDSALTYSGVSTSTITGLWHLEGQVVYALVNGVKQGPFTVATGRITLTSAGTLAHVGFLIRSVVTTVDLDALAQAGTAKGAAKRISQVRPSFYRSYGGQIGPSEDHLDTIIWRDSAGAPVASPQLITALTEVDFPSGWDREAHVCFVHEEPYPFAYLGVVQEASVSG